MIEIKLTFQKKQKTRPLKSYKDRGIQSAHNALWNWPRSSSSQKGDGDYQKELLLRSSSKSERRWHYQKELGLGHL